MDNPKVSIVIPVYNGANYLRESIDSALAQTYCNIEVIVVNDGSTDNTEQICHSYANKIRYFAKENGGVATALNMGIEKMHGEYFSWLSHDDTYYPHKIEAQINALRESGDRFKIVFGDYDIYDEDTKQRETIVLKQLKNKDLLTESVYPVVHSMIAGCSMLVHRSHFERVGLFDEKLIYVQDYDLWFRILWNQKSIYLNELTYTARSHSLQGTRTMREEMKLEEIKLWKMYVNKLHDEEMSMIYGSKFLFLAEMNCRIKAYDSEDNELRDVINQCEGYTETHMKLTERFSEICKGQNLPIIVFGAGNWGLRVYHLLVACGFNVEMFVDNNQQKQNTGVIDGVLCKSIEDVIGLKDKFMVIVALKMNGDVLKQLREFEFPYVLTKQQVEKILTDLA